MAKGSYQVSAVPVTIFAHLLVIAVSTLVLVWLLYFRGGLAFKSQNKQKIFNVHPLLMVVGFLLPAGEAIMAYKSIPAKKEVQKLVHLVLHFIALACGIVGIYAVFKFHNEARVINMYTLHSWIGMSTICLFGIQWLLGFFSFWWPRAEQGTRAKYMPWHVFLGAVIFFMATVTAETGLVEKFLFLGLGKSQEALIVNFTGLLILLFAVSVGLTVVLPRSSY
ncbi:probable ascorbate-specific transmembrane electron transporter 1 [Diospyros lotus]|uniref:probable ascorbate-specific transmembrane electron transporter 1 n=1 Tax=Diospyros lotus TaxID=55363 RepID=UPI0022541983|nr:probable ascorbate-specific transmembrane electron transporter 1 [Diospyros lotus]XP_052204626.1 probable ascorbate-specific transmembrane electron transporter 1 [Diospyros lotus]